MDRRSVVGLLLLIVTLAVYARTLRFDFVNFDDPNYVSENMQVQAGLTGESIAWAWTSGHAENWHPITWMSHMLDRDLFGPGPMGPHGMNAALHGINAVLVFLALLWMTSALGASAWIAAIFALHPLHVESVAWISERKDLLSTLFGLLSMLSYVAYAKRPRPGPYVFTVLMLGLSLMAKPMLVTLPCVFLLLDRWPLERTRQVSIRRLLIEKLPLLAMVVAMSAVALRVQSATETDLAGLPMGPRLANSVNAYAAYLRQGVWPTQLCIFYPHPFMPGGEPLSTGEIVRAAGLILGLSALVAWLKRPYVTVGWLWFLGMLVPTIGLVQVGGQAYADRYTYVPLIGISIALAFGIREWLDGRSAGTQRVVAGLGTLSIIGCGVLTWVQLGSWENSETLYRHGLEVEPGSGLMHSNLAVHYMGEGDSVGAREHFERALEIDAHLVYALGSFGILLRGQGDFAGAEPLLRRALVEKPEYSAARINLGWSLAAQGKLVAARDELQRVLTGEPGNALAHRVLGMTLEGEGKIGQARRSYERSLTLDATPPTHMLLAQLLLRQGSVDAARTQLDHALQLDPDNPEAHFDLGTVQFAMGNRAAALRSYRRALELGHDVVVSATRVGELLLAKGNARQALAHFDQALAQRPGHEPALRGQAQARAALSAGGQ